MEQKKNNFVTIPLYICFYFYMYVVVIRAQTPADAEYNFLEHAKRLDMYGVDLNVAQLKVGILDVYNYVGVTMYAYVYFM